MADIGKESIGELNIHKVIRGYARTWMTVHPGDITADTVSAFVNDNGIKVDLTAIMSSYNETTDSTTITYTLSSEDSEKLSNGVLDWSMILTENLVQIPYLHGSFHVEDL
jgi:hypothetical protein